MKIYYFKKSHRDYYNIMRISIIVLFFLIIGCETTQRNPKCEDVRAFKVFQVLDKFVLASICEYYDTQYCMGHTVIFKKEKGKIYYDDQVIKVKDNECAIYTGTYRYQTQGGVLFKDIGCSKCHSSYLHCTCNVLFDEDVTNIMIGYNFAHAFWTDKKA